MSKDAPTRLPTNAQRLANRLGPAALPALLDGLAANGMAIAIFDPEDRLVFYGPAFRDAFDVQDGPQTFESVIRHCHSTMRGALILTDDIDTWLATANEKRRSMPNRKFEVDLTDGRWMWAVETTYNDGWIMLVLQDFTSLKQREIGLEHARDAALHAAETDPLTGLANRRAIMRYLDDCVQLASEGVPLSIALIDIDYFKKINDSYGHHAGDDVLRHFGRYCTHIFRNSDRVGRIGGEEFLLIMPNTGWTAAVTALQRFKHHLHRASQLLPQRLGFTFSAGVVEWQAPMTSSDLYKDADGMLYQAKAGGRNLIIATGNARPDSQAAAGQGGV